MRIVFIAVGIVLIVFSFWTHCAKKLMVDYAVAWSLLGGCLILMGVVPAFSAWVKHLGIVTEWVFFCIGGLVLSTGVHASLVISQITLENKELAMQVALLNQESEAIRAEIERLAGVQEEDNAEKDPVCDQHYGPGRCGNGAAGAAPAFGRPEI